MGSTRFGFTIQICFELPQFEWNQRLLYSKSPPIINSVNIRDVHILVTFLYAHTAFSGAKRIMSEARSLRDSVASGGAFFHIFRKLSYSKNWTEKFFHGLAHWQPNRSILSLRNLALISLIVSEKITKKWKFGMMPGWGPGYRGKVPHL